MRKFVSLGQRYLSESKEICNSFLYSYPEQFDPSNRHQRETVIKWYQDESFAFKLLNAVLRGTEDPLALAYVEFFAQDLMKVIKFLS